MHNDFKCIVLLEEKELQLQDPPFLNRFEKQILEFDWALNHTDIEIAVAVYKNLIQLLTLKRCLLPLDVFILKLSQEEVFSVIHRLKTDHPGEKFEEKKLMSICYNQLLKKATADFPVLLELLKPEASKERLELIDELEKIYFENQRHSSVLSYFQRESEVGKGQSEAPEVAEESKGEHEPLRSSISKKKLIIYTYSNIYEKLEGLSNLLGISQAEVEDLRIDSFVSERQFRERFLKRIKNKSLLILRFLARSQAKIFSHVKHLIDTHLNEQSADTSKIFIFILHIERETVFEPENLLNIPSISPLSDWDAVFIDNLNATQDIKAMTKMKLGELFKEYDFKDMITVSFSQAVTKLKFEDANVQINVSEHFREMLDFIGKSEHFEELVKSRMEMEINQVNDWREELLIQGNHGYKRSDIVGSMRNMIEEKIENAVLFFIYLMEKECLMDSFLHLEKQISKEDVNNKEIYIICRDALMEEFKNLYIGKSIQISNTLQGNAISEKVWDLHFPFSHPIFNTLLPSVEAQKNLLLRVDSLRGSENKQELLSQEEELICALESINRKFLDLRVVKNIFRNPDLKLFLEEIILTDLVREFIQTNVHLVRNPEVENLLTDFLIYHVLRDQKESLPLARAYVWLKTYQPVLARFLNWMCLLLESKLSVLIGSLRDKLARAKMVGDGNLIKMLLDITISHILRSDKFFAAAEKNPQAKLILTILPTDIAFVEKEFEIKTSFKIDISFYNDFVELCAENKNDALIRELFENRVFDSEEYTTIFLDNKALGFMMKQLENIKANQERKTASVFIFEVEFYQKILDFCQHDFEREKSIIDACLANKSHLKYSSKILSRFIVGGALIVGSEAKSLFSCFEDDESLKPRLYIDEKMAITESHDIFVFVSDILTRKLDKERENIKSLVTKASLKKKDKSCDSSNIKNVALFFKEACETVVAWLKGGKASDKLKNLKLALSFSLIRIIVEIHDEILYEDFLGSEEPCYDTTLLNSLIFEVKARSPELYFLIRVYLLKILKKNLGSFESLKAFPFDKYGNMSEFLEGLPISVDKSSVVSLDYEIYDLDNRVSHLQAFTHTNGKWGLIGRSEEILRDFEKNCTSEGYLKEFLNCMVTDIYLKHYNKGALSSMFNEVQKIWGKRISDLNLSDIQKSLLQSYIMNFPQDGSSSFLQIKEKLNISNDDIPLIREKNMFLTFMTHTANILFSRTRKANLYNLLIQKEKNFAKEVNLTFFPGIEEGLVNRNLKHKERMYKKAFNLLTREKGVYICSCYFVYYLGDCGNPWVTDTCPSCRQAIGGRHHVIETREGHFRLFSSKSDASIVGKEFHGAFKLKSEMQGELMNELYLSALPGIRSFDKEYLKDQDYSVRDLTPLNTYFFGFVNFSFVYMCWKLNRITLAELGDVVKYPSAAEWTSEKADQYFAEELESCFMKIRKLIPSSFCKSHMEFLHSLLGKFYSFLESTNLACKSLDERVTFENSWEAFITPFLNDHNNQTTIDIQNYKKESHLIRLHANQEGQEMQLWLDEVNDIRKKSYKEKEPERLKKSLAPMFRIINTNYQEILHDNINKPAFKRQYPYFSTYLNKKDQIEKLEQAWHIIDFINVARRSNNYLYSRLEASSEIKIANFIHDNQALMKAFEKFCKAQAHFVSDRVALQFDCKVIDVKKEYSLEDPIACILIDSKEIPGLYLAALMQGISVLQNEVLNELLSSLSVSPGNKLIQEEMANRKRVQDCRPEDLLENCHFDIEKEIKDIAFNNLEYGHGQEIELFLESTDREIQNRFFRRKRLLLEQEFSFIQYHNEISQEVQLILQLEEKLRQQDSLPQSKLLCIEDFFRGLEAKDFLEIYRSFNCLLFHSINDNGIVLEKNESLSELFFRIKKTYNLDSSLGTLIKSASLEFEELKAAYELAETYCYPHIEKTIDERFKKPVPTELIDLSEIVFDSYLKEANLANLSRLDLAKALQRYILRYLGLGTNVREENKIADYVGYYEDLCQEA